MGRDKETGEWLTCEECGCEIRGGGTRYCSQCRHKNRGSNRNEYYEERAESTKVDRICREQIQDLKEQQKADNAKYRNDKSNYDRLMEVEAEIKQKNKRVEELEGEISGHEEKKEDSALREAFLEYKEKEVEIYTKKFEDFIKSLEKKRDIFYKSFFDECTSQSEEYQKITAKLVDEYKKIEKEAEKIIQSSSKNFIGRYLKSLSIFFWKINERNKIRKEVHSRFVKSHNMDEMSILMLDKPLFYLMKTKSLLYAKFVDKFNLGEKEKYVFDLNKFNKIDSLPSKSFIILKDEFMEKNKAEFLNFMNLEKEKLNRIIAPLKSEKNNVENRIKSLNELRKELKDKICPQCRYRDKSKDKRICPDCAAKNQRYLNGMKQSSPIAHGTATAVGHTAYNLTHPKKYRHYD